MVNDDDQWKEMQGGKEMVLKELKKFHSSILIEKENVECKTNQCSLRFEKNLLWPTTMIDRRKRKVEKRWFEIVSERVGKISFSNFNVERKS